MEIIYDDSSGFWTGRPWLIIAEEGSPAIASFATKEEAEAFVAED